MNTNLFKSNKMKLLTVLISLSLVFIGQAQSIEKFSIDSGGATATAGGIQMLYTIGEVNVQEYSSENLSVSEGFINNEVLTTLAISEPEIYKQKIIVYPNPTSEIININTKIKITKIKMYDALGRQVSDLRYSNKISVGSFESGVYFIRLYFDKASVVRRIIIE